MLKVFGSRPRVNARFSVSGIGCESCPLLNGKVQPYLLDETRGAKLGVPDTPVLGRIRQTSRNNNIVENRTYFVMFGNPGKAVQSGDRVSLLLGDIKITDLTVQ